MATFEELSKARNVARDKVFDWMSIEAAKGNVRTHDQCPHWIQYLAAEKAFCDSVKRPQPNAETAATHPN